MSASSHRADRVSQIVNLLAAVGSPAGNQDVHPESFRARVSRIVLRVDDELNFVVGIVLIEDRLDVFLEFRVGSLAWAKHDDPVVTGCGGRPIRPHVSSRTNPVEECEDPLEDCDHSQNVHRSSLSTL